MSHRIIGLTAESARHSSQSPCLGHVFVVFTNSDSTLTALRYAATWAQGLTQRVSVIVLDPAVKQAEYSGPVQAAALTARWFRFMEPGGSDFEVTIAVCGHEDWGRLLPPASVVVIAGPKSWSSSKKQRLEEGLRNRGHHVLLINPEDESFRCQIHALRRLQVTGNTEQIFNRKADARSSQNPLATPARTLRGARRFHALVRVVLERIRKLF